MSAWISGLTTKSMIILSLIVGFVFTANQGVGVSGWLYEWLRDTGFIWVGVLFNLFRNTLLAALVVFAFLYVVRRTIAKPDVASSETP